jgi:hypothetical protein
MISNIIGSILADLRQLLSIQVLSRIKQSFGIFYFLFGLPITFFFRDFLKLAPNNPIFSAVVSALALAVIIPADFLRKLYKPSPTLTKFGIGFLIVSIWYYTFYTSAFVDIKRETINYILVFAFFFLLLHVSNDIKDYAIPVVAIITFVASILLFFSIYKSKTYIIGMRFAIYAGDDDAGNPHLIGRNGYFGLIASFLLFQSKKLYWKAFAMLNILVSMITILGSLSRATFLSAVVCGGLWALFHLRASTFKGIKKELTRPRSLLIIVGMIAYGIYYINKNPAIGYLFINYYDGAIRFAEKAINTISGQQSKEIAYDDSAGNRLQNIAAFVETFFYAPQRLILGEGYKSYYLDVPILEAWFNCGIFAFITFAGFIFLMLKEAIFAIKNTPNTFQTFLGYSYIVFFIGAFTGGRPYDTSFWFMFILYMRFMGIIPISSPSTEVESKQVLEEA